ncbi:alpha/beta fold hydrolase [Altericroceibacterium endophyticum]|uniref:Alpha/beta fold hydrolase n=1 Tax=Altericroceibacterium endophyticum TaxID=1808508 RepID=A0A6I4T2X1_9SPHN|nr:alpha/beta fold hydrolase [Altericroceibacterium endophyticum]MXO64463.1 alpha/beta fold hydrolase [Altericroceibacterium endophyticum]
MTKKETFAGFDGTELALHRMGEGRPIVLLHGLFSSAEMNWIRFGHAKQLAEAGFEVLMPDLRAHGESGKPHDPAAYPPDVLVRDAMALVEHCNLTDFDLAGFSLGARTAVRAVLAGLAPRRLALCGMGLEGLAGWDKRAAFFIDAIDRFDEIKHGDPAFFAVSFMKTMKVDREAARLLLQSVDDTETSELRNVDMRTLIICGDKDRDNGSPDKLADALPDASTAEIPGTHMSSVAESALGDALCNFFLDDAAD